MPDLITSDLHLTDNLRDAYRFKACKVISDYARKIDADTVFILGDLTEDKDNHSSVLVNRVVAMLGDFAQNGREIYIIMGNHDAVDPSSPFFHFINHIPRLHFIREVQQLGRYLLVPNGMWPESISADTEMILTHATFKGARGEGGFALEGMAIPHVGCPIISGDVHTPQTVGPVTYVGAPSLIDFGDDYKPRILRVNLDMSVDSINIKSPGKRLVQATLHADGGVSFPTTGFNMGDIVKIRMAVDAGITPEAISDGRDRLKKWAEYNKVTLYGTDIALPKQALPERKAERRSDLELVRAYAVNEGFDKLTTAVGESIVHRVTREATQSNDPPH